MDCVAQNESSVFVSFALGLSDRNREDHTDSEIIQHRWLIQRENHWMISIVSIRRALANSACAQYSWINSFNRMKQYICKFKLSRCKCSITFSNTVSIEKNIFWVWVMDSFLLLLEPKWKHFLVNFLILEVSLKVPWSCCAVSARSQVVYFSKAMLELLPKQKK